MTLTAREIEGAKNCPLWIKIIVSIGTPLFYYAYALALMSGPA